MIPSRGCGENLQEDAQPFVKLERAIIAVLLGVALLMFFFPILIIHVPIAGDQSVTGYDVFAKAKQFQQNIDAGTHQDPNPKPANLPSRPVMNQMAQPEISDVPASLKNAWTMPLLIFATFTCAALALLSLFTFKDATSALGIVGGLCGVLAIVNVIVIGSDFKTWLAQSMKVAEQHNPFAGIGALMFNSFNLTVGIGLYALTFCLFLTAFFVHTRVLSRVRLESQ